MLWSWSKRTIFDKNQTRRKITRKKGEISVSKHVGRTTLESRVSNFENFSPLIIFMLQSCTKHIIHGTFCHLQWTGEKYVYHSNSIFYNSTTLVLLPPRMKTNEQHTYDVL